jgi:hypothetical protein
VAGVVDSVTCERCYQPLEVGEHGQYLCPLEPRNVRVSIIDDQLEGGPRRFDTMGDDEPFIESKSQWKREVEKRELIHVDRHDRNYYRTKFKQHDERLRDLGL